MKTVQRPPSGQDEEVKRVESIRDYDYAMMDRITKSYTGP